MDEQCSAVSQVPGLISRVVLFSENIRVNERNRQTSSLWQYRAVHYSASRGKNGTSYSPAVRWLSVNLLKQEIAAHILSVIRTGCKFIAP